MPPRFQQLAQLLVGIRLVAGELDQLEVHPFTLLDLEFEDRLARVLVQSDFVGDLDTG